MQLNNLEVSVERDRKDSFVTVSQSFIDSALTPRYNGRVPAVVPLRVTRADGKDVYVGCLAQHPHRQQKLKLLCSLALAADLGLNAGEQVACAPTTWSPRATKVLVAPVSVDDSEVVEQNAMRIEMELLRQLQVVFPRQRITVAIYAGVHAKMQVQRIEYGQGEELAESGGCAVMDEGTHFIVATRMRQSADADAQPTGEEASPPKKCTWSFLRGRPCSDAEKQQITAAAVAGSTGASSSFPASASVSSSFIVGARTAARFGWTSEKLYQLIDLAALAALEKPEITPSFLRSDAVVLSRLLIRPDTEDPDGDDGTAAVPHLLQASNLLLLPTTEKAQVAAAAAAAAAAGDGAFSGEEVRSPSTAVPSALGRDDSSTLPSIADLQAVHGVVPGDLLEYLRYVFKQPRQQELQHLSHNILLCGGKGYGKTTIVRSVLHHLRSDVHSVFVECVSGKHTLPKLRSALLECALCAPSVLVLDGFDTIAAEQKEGNVQAMSAATRATLEAVVTTFTRVFSFAGATSPCGGSIVVIGTCANREGVNEAFRSAWCFQKFIAVNALTRVSRCVLLAQLFPAATKDEVNRMATFMDNYTPFDVIQIATRIRSALAAAAVSHGGQAPPSLVESTETVAASFTPLAHEGIKFLKGDRLDWSSIGGLADAKKVLYDTLVLPMRHPKLFARLPLKTRSGILLYGASGCGKTFVIESLVKAENINCIVVNGPEVFGKYIGQSEQKIRDVFERAAAAAPCVVFFDEFDSVAPQRGVDNSGVTDRVVNQLLCYLDGVEGRKDVYVVAASSRPDLIDAALLRPGRLDKAVQCPVPSHEDRVAILTHLLGNVPSADAVPASAVERIAAETENWTPADLSAVVSTANMLVNQRMMDRLTAESTSGDRALKLGEEDNQAYYIADVGAGVSRDKIVDALKAVLAQSAASADHATLLSENKMTEADLVKAMGATRPSLSAKDIAKQRKIHALFSKGESLPIPAPGTKLTFS